MCDEYDDSCGPRLDFVLDLWTLFIYLFIYFMPFYTTVPLLGSERERLLYKIKKNIYVQFYTKSLCSNP